MGIVILLSLIFQHIMHVENHLSQMWETIHILWKESPFLKVPKRLMHGVYTLQMHGYTQDRNNRFFETKAKKTQRG